MLHVARSALNALLLALNTVAVGPPDARPEPNVLLQADRHVVTQRPVPMGARTGSLPFVRTELYFGTAKPSGVVSEAEFLDFVDRHVTPRFPDGLTLIKGDGQFRNDGHTIVKEQSFVLILLYPHDALDEGLRRIERIRTLYKDEFDQQSVVRVDDPYIVWVSF